jgi:transposase-like protein
VVRAVSRRLSGCRLHTVFWGAKAAPRGAARLALIAVAVTTEGRREIVGLGLGPSEAEPFWSAFLKGLVKRGLKGIKPVISDAHDGLRHAITRVLGATWQRCRVHWMRNALAHLPKGQHTMVAAAIRQAFLQTNTEAAHQTWRQVADQLRPRWPKRAALMDDREHDGLAYMTFPAQHRTQLHSTNPLERLNKEVKRRADVVGIFANEASIARLIGAVLSSRTTSVCSSAATCRSRESPNLHRRCSMPSRANFHPWPLDQWPPQTPPQFPPP